MLLIILNSLSPKMDLFGAQLIFPRSGEMLLRNSRGHGLTPELSTWRLRSQKVGRGSLKRSTTACILQISHALRWRELTVAPLLIITSLISVIPDYLKHLKLYRKQKSKRQGPE